jgi:hypothetical protein
MERHVMDLEKEIFANLEINRPTVSGITIPI